MAIIYMDSFDTNDSEYRMTSGTYESWNAYQSPWGTPMAKAYFNYVWRRRDISANSNNSLFLCGTWVLRPGAADYTIIQPMNYNQNQTANFYVAADGRVAASRWNEGALTFISTLAPFENSAPWKPHWVEMRANYADVGGYIQMYVDGQLCVNVSNTDTNNGGTPSVDALRFNNGPFLDDVVWWDNNAPGLVESSFPIGPQRIVTLRPESNFSVQFTASTGSNNFALIDESTPNTADYVFSITSNHTDLYNLPDLPYTPNTVNGVQVKSMAWNSSSTGNSIMRNIIQSNTVTYESNNIPMFYSQRINYSIWDRDPNGNTAWTANRINSLRSGFKIV